MLSRAWLARKALVIVRCKIPAFQVGGPSCRACCLLCMQLQTAAQGGLSQDSNASHPHHHLQQVAPLLSVYSCCDAGSSMCGVIYARLKCATASKLHWSIHAPWCSAAACWYIRLVQTCYPACHDGLKKTAECSRDWIKQIQHMLVCIAAVTCLACSVYMSPAHSCTA